MSQIRRSLPDKHINLFPRNLPIKVILKSLANSTPHAVKPERDTSIGISIKAVFIAISEVSRVLRTPKVNARLHTEMITTAEDGPDRAGYPEPNDRNMEPN